MAEAADAFARFDQGMTERQALAFEQGVPGSRVIRIPGGTHYLFITHEPDVLREVTAFIAAISAR